MMRGDTGREGGDERREDKASVSLTGASVTPARRALLRGADRWTSAEGRRRSEGGERDKERQERADDKTPTPGLHSPAL